MISRDLVLTAAHCVKAIPLAAAVVLYEGAKPVRPAIPVRSVRRYVVSTSDLPAEYAGLLELSLDTAILQLASPVRDHQPVRISRSSKPPPGLRLAGAGLCAEIAARAQREEDKRTWLGWPTRRVSAANKHNNPSPKRSPEPQGSNAACPVIRKSLGVRAIVCVLRAFSPRAHHNPRLI